MIKSLLYKNFFLFCETIRYPAIAIAIYWIMAVVSSFFITNDGEIWIVTSGATGITALIIFFVMDTIVEKDKKSGWNKYALTTEVSVSKLLFGQYAFALLVTLAMSIICFLLTLICFLINGKQISAEIFIPGLIIMSMVLITFALDIPLSYKFSTIMVSIIKLSTFAGLTILIVVDHINGTILSPVFKFISENFDFVKFLMIIIPFVFYALSWLVFRKIRISV